MRQVIRVGRKKAAYYNLTTECCVRSYIEFICLLGSGFDTDPLMPWAARILNDKATFDEVKRGDRLYDQVWDYIDYISTDYRDTAGEPITERFVEEIKGLRKGCGEELTKNNYQEFAENLGCRIKTFFPAKYRYVGENRVHSLINQGYRSAGDYGISTKHGITLYTVYMFVLGSGFDDDPLLPWANATLNDAGLSNQAEKINRLYAEGVQFLRRWWDSAPEKED